MHTIDRRTFLTATGVLAAATSLPLRAAQARTAPRAAPPADPPAVTPIRLAVKYGMIAGATSVRHAFEMARDAGFEGVEMPAPSDLDLAEVRAAAEATGLSIPGVVDSVHWNKPLSHPDASVRAEGLAALERAIRDASELNAASVLLVPAVVSKALGYADAYQRSQAEIRKVVPLARDLGVRIAIENVWNSFLLSPLEAARYTDEIDPDVMAWHFDVGNIVNIGWPEHWIRTLGPRITRLDVKEYSRSKRDTEGLWKGFDVEIGEGDCGWPEVMLALDEIGYNGWACAEVAGGGPQRLADIAARMRTVLTSGRRMEEHE